MACARFLLLKIAKIVFRRPEVAAVAAVSSDLRRRRAQVDQSRLRRMPFVVDMDAAMADSAPRVFGSGSNVSRHLDFERRQCRTRTRGRGEHNRGYLHDGRADPRLPRDAAARLQLERGGTS